MTPRQERFVAEYLIDLNAAQAAIRAGYSPTTARAIGSENLTKPDIAKAIETERSAHAEQLELKAEDVLRRLWQVATVDRNELVELRRAPCRYCYGIGGEFQERAHERKARERAYQRQWGAKIRAARTAAEMEAIPPFDERGGIGYSRRRAINPNCAACDGWGVPEVFVKDTRHLSEAARAAYVGVKLTPWGPLPEIMSGERALELVARHLGLFDERPAEPAISRPTAPVDFPDDPAAASAAYLRIIIGR